MPEPEISVDHVKSEWLERLEGLVFQIEVWARELDWSTRRIEKRMEDSIIGRYEAPALILQQDVVKLFLEPITRSSPGANGVVDLYLMPAYDDIASFYFTDDAWRLHYMFPGQPTVSTIADAEAQPLTKETLNAVLREMKSHAGAQV